MHYDVARARLGPERAVAFWSLTERALDRMAELAGDALRRVGSLRLAADEQERDELRAEHDALLMDGFAVEWIDELPEPLADTYHAAILHPEDGALHPARWVRRLASRAAEAGAEIREGARVTSLDELDAEHVVIASDGYPSGLVEELDDVVRPTRGQVVATEPLPELLYERPHYTRRGFDYWQQLPDGRLVAGGRRDVTFEAEFTADEVTTAPVQDALELLLQGLVGYLPAITHRWSGIFGTSPGRPSPRRPGPWAGADLGLRGLLGARKRARARIRRPGREGDPRPARARARVVRSCAAPVGASGEIPAVPPDPSSPDPASARSRRSPTSRMRCPRCPSRAQTSPCRGRGSSLPQNRRAPAPSRLRRRGSPPRSR